MSKRETIYVALYVALLDEGIDVWRPVEAERLAPDRWLALRVCDHRSRPGVESGTRVRLGKENLPCSNETGPVLPRTEPEP